MHAHKPMRANEVPAMLTPSCSGQTMQCVNTMCNISTSAIHCTTIEQLSQNTTSWSHLLSPLMDRTRSDSFIVQLTTYNCLSKRH
jgi:hypothetical protein